MGGGAGVEVGVGVEAGAGAGVEVGVGVEVHVTGIGSGTGSATSTVRPPTSNREATDPRSVASVGASLYRLRNAVPEARGTPPDEAVVARGPRAAALGHVAPGRGSEPSEDAVAHAAIVASRHPLRRVRQQRLDNPLFRVDQVATARDFLAFERAEARAVLAVTLLHRFTALAVVVNPTDKALWTREAQTPLSSTGPAASLEDVC